MSTAIYHALKTNKGRAHWEDLVGYSLDDLIIHLEKKFIKGMSWDNYGKWQIDHSIPVSVFNFKTAEDIGFKRCWSLTNLKPMWAVKNIIKSNKLTKDFQQPLL